MAPLLNPLSDDITTTPSITSTPPPTRKHKNDKFELQKRRSAPGAACTIEILCQAGAVAWINSGLNSCDAVVIGNVNT